VFFQSPAGGRRWLVEVAGRRSAVFFQVGGEMLGQAGEDFSSSAAFFSESSLQVFQVGGCWGAGLSSAGSVALPGERGRLLGRGSLKRRLSSYKLLRMGSCAEKL
jgi:hypothetical protein